MNRPRKPRRPSNTNPAHSSTHVTHRHRARVITLPRYCNINLYARWGYRVNIKAFTRRQFYGSVGVVAIISFLLSLWINRHTWFIGDDFAILTTRYFAAADGNWTQALLLPHNDHLVALPVFVFIGLGHLVGLDNHLVYMLPAIFMHIAILFAIAIILKERCSSTLTALSAVCCVAFMSAGYEVLMMATNMAHVAPIFLGLYQLILVDHDGNISKRDIVASMLGVIAVLCAGTSIPLIATIALFLILQRRFKRAMLIAVPPATLWLIWFVQYGTLNHGVKGDTQYATFSKMGQIAQYVINGIRGSLEAITHIGGASTFIIILCFLGLYKKSIKSQPILMPFCMTVGAVLFYCITGFSRVTFGEPTSSRYVYLGTIFIIPLVFIGIESLLEHLNARHIFTIAATVWIGAMGIIGFLAATETSPYTHPARREAIESVRDLVASGPTTLTGAPSPIFDPDLTVDWIKRLVNNNMWNG